MSQRHYLPRSSGIATFHPITWPSQTQQEILSPIKVVKNSPSHSVFSATHSLCSQFPTHSTNRLSRLPLAANHSLSLSSAPLSLLRLSIFALASRAWIPLSTAVSSSGV